VTSGKIAVVTDSTSDLGPLAVRNGIEVVPLTIRFGNEEFRDGVDLTEDAFYRKLDASTSTPITAQPAPSLFVQTYRRVLESGAAGIVSLHLPDTLSGTINAAGIAAREVDPVRISVVDARTASAGLGMLAIEAARRARLGEDAAAIAAAIAADTAKMGFYSTIPSLTYLARGGRIGHLSGLVGNVLKIVPILTIEDGRIKECAKVRTFARAVEQIVEMVISKIQGRSGVRIAIIHSLAPELAQSVADRLVAAASPGSLIICPVGPTVGTHAGPGAVGVFFIP
jgi:DegV family protein with EDD domain